MDDVEYRRGGISCEVCTEGNPIEEGMLIGIHTGSGGDEAQ